MATIEGHPPTRRYLHGYCRTILYLLSPLKVFVNISQTCNKLTAFNIPTIDHTDGQAGSSDTSHISYASAFPIQVLISSSDHPPNSIGRFSFQVKLEGGPTDGPSMRNVRQSTAKLCMMLCDSKKSVCRKMPIFAMDDIEIKTYWP